MMKEKYVRFVALAITAGLGIGATTHASAAEETLIVLSKRIQSLAVVDPRTLNVIARIPTGPDPHEVAVSTDGKMAFVTNYGFGDNHTIRQIDLVERKTIRTIDISPLRGPHGITYVADHAWFTAEVNKVVGRLDPQAGKVDLLLGTGQDRTHMIYVSPDQRRIITTNVSSASVSIIDKGPSRPTARPTMPVLRDGEIPQMPVMTEEWRSTVVKVGAGSEGFDVSPDASQIWVANAREGTVSIIDTTTKQVSRTLHPGLIWPNRLKFTPDGKVVLISQLFTHDVVVIDARSGEIINRIPVGKGSAGILIQPDGARAYVACWQDGYVAVVDLKQMTVVGKVTDGIEEPDGMAWARR